MCRSSLTDCVRVQVAEANSTPYGLASTVMSKDLGRAARVANGIRAGAGEFTHYAPRNFLTERSLSML